MPKAMRAVTAAAIILAIGLVAAVPMWMPKPQIEFDITGYDFDFPGVAFFSFNPYGPVHTTTMPEKYTFVNPNTPLIVAPHWKNSGSAPTTIELTLTVTNANITWVSNFGSDNRTIPEWATQADGQTCNKTSVTILSQPEGQSPLLYRYIDILPMANAPNFIVTLSVKDTTSDFTSLIAHGQTAFTYVLADASSNLYRLDK